MKKHLFLTGPSGVGKTTLLHEELGWMLQTAGGLATVREKDSSGRVLGYDLLPAAALGGVAGYTPLRFLDYSVDPPARDNEVFRSEGVRLLNEARYYNFALLDEIGGYELLIPEFRHALEELLNSETPVIGVLKSRENAAALSRRFSLGSKFDLQLAQLHSALGQDEDTVILTMTQPGDPICRSVVAQWVREYV